MQQSLDSELQSLDGGVRISDADPYPWPWDGRFDPARLALVIVGMQRIHGAASTNVAPATEVIADLAACVRRAGGVVVQVNHTSPAAGAGPVSGRPRPLMPRVGDEEWAPLRRSEPTDLLVEAGGHDAFCDSRLDAELRSVGARYLAVVGFASEVTVSGTVRSANDRGYECLTVTDALAPLSPDTSAHELHSATMSGGIFGALGNSRALLELIDMTSHASTTPPPGGRT